MIYRLLISAVILCFSSSGCIFLLADALGHNSAKKTAGNRSPKSPEIRSGTPGAKEIEGTREDVFNTTVTILLNRGFFIKASNYPSGMIVAEIQDPSYAEIRAFLEPLTQARVRMRLTITNKNGVDEDSQIFSKMFDDIQAEVFRREVRRRSIRN